MITIMTLQVNNLGYGNCKEIEVKKSKRGYFVMQKENDIETYESAKELAEILDKELKNSRGIAQLAFDDGLYTEVTGKTVDFPAILNKMLPLSDGAFDCIFI